jgi:hypothetical protein
VRVIVLDNSKDVGQNQLEWLIAELAQAKAGREPAIVIGNADLSAQATAGDANAGAVADALLAGGASAYFFDSPEENVTKPLRVGATSIPTFGSGTLGYVDFTAESSGEFLGASGYMLGQVDVAARKENNVAPVTARLIPSIGELALEAKDGTLLRRSNPALFDALARRPRAGNRSQGGGEVRKPGSTPIPTSRSRPTVLGPDAPTNAWSRSTRSAPRAKTSVTSWSRTSHRPIHTLCCSDPTTSRSTTRPRVCSAPTTPERRSLRSARVACPRRCR